MKPSNLFHSLFILLGAALCAIPNFAQAQNAANSCAPSANVQAGFQQLSKINGQAIPYKAQLDQQATIMHSLLQKHPNDFHLQMRYQNDRRYNFTTDQDSFLAEYRTAKEKNPTDPAASYLYARLLIGRNTKEAITELEKLLARAPEFPWSYLELARIYSYPNFRDRAKSNTYLKQWLTKCPESMNSFSLLMSSGDTEIKAAFAQRLRVRLEAATTDEQLKDWDNLWTLMFSLRPLPEHAQVRQQVTADLQRLRSLNINSQEWFQALQAGYKVLGDKEGQRWAEDELIRRFPQSATAKQWIQNRWREEHPYPKAEDSAERKRAYHEAVVQITPEWLKRWPDDEFIWSSRMISLSELEGTTPTEIAEAFDGYARSHEKNAGHSYSLPPVETRAATIFLQRGLRLEQIPTILQKGIADIERMESRSRDDLYPRADREEDSNLRYVRWLSWPLLAEAYAKLKQPAKAREALALMAEALKKEKPDDKAKESTKATYAFHQVTFWQGTAKVAEAEQRKLDALTAYQTALAFRLKSATPKPGKKDELSDNAQRLWKDLGGTEEGWQAYLARSEAAKSKTEVAETATWDTKNTVLPDFDLTDLQGRKWKLADLKGKVAFINLWATWCGPCRLELPYVQKLSEQMKDRKDVLVLTVSIDEEIGLIEPFMKENKYNFTVLPAQSYAEGLGVYSIPRNWVVSAEGKLAFEGIGFGGEGEEWMKRAMEMIQKVKAGN